MLLVIPFLEYFVYPHFQRSMKIKIRPIHKVYSRLLIKLTMDSLIFRSSLKRGKTSSVQLLWGGGGGGGGGGGWGLK